tara:strand:+ start:763 stop:1536 length:774 start_codon:yes stop_codon:yes gene_type:complete
MPPFIEKIQNGQLCLGTCISLSDAQAVEALAPDADLLWIDTEHSSIPLDSIKTMMMAVKGTDTAALVRVPWNDPVLVKPVLDLGAHGIIFPMIRTADDVRQAVAACRYPPAGVRGFGPLRPLDYGRQDAIEFCDDADENIIVVVQIEQAEAVENIEEIVAVEGLTSLAFGPMDLSASLGHRGQPGHPAVEEAVKHVVQAAKAAGVATGVSIGSAPESVKQWADYGLDWICYGVDVTLMIQCFNNVATAVRSHVEHGT